MTEAVEGDLVERLRQRAHWARTAQHEGHRAYITKLDAKLFDLAAAALSRAEAEREARDKAITYLTVLCEQFAEGLNWSDADRCVIASTKLELIDLRRLAEAPSLVSASLSRTLSNE